MKKLLLLFVRCIIMMELRCELFVEIILRLFPLMVEPSIFTVLLLVLLLFPDANAARCDSCEVDRNASTEPALLLGLDAVERKLFSGGARADER